MVFGVAVYLDGESATFFILAAINTEKAREEIFMQLVVTEKPSVAQAIARVIGACERKDGYMEGNASAS